MIKIQGLYYQENQPKMLSSGYAYRILGATRESIIGIDKGFQIISCFLHNCIRSTAFFCSNYILFKIVKFSEHLSAPSCPRPFPQTVINKQITIFLKFVDYCKWRKNILFHWGRKGCSEQTWETILVGLWHLCISCKWDIHCPFFWMTCAGMSV